MLANSHILPVKVSSRGINYVDTDNEESDDSTFGNIETVPMGVFIGIIVSIIALYIFWALFVRNLIKIIKTIFPSCKSQNWDQDEIKENDIY